MTASSPPIRWTDPVDRIKGLGPQRAEFLKSQGLGTIGDLLLRAPLRFIDRRQSPPFKSLVNPPPGEVTAVGTIESVGEKGFGRKKRLICIVGDGTGFLQAVWFTNYFYYKPELTPGRRVAFTGRVTLFNGPQMTHPKVTFLDGDRSPTTEAALVPVYPSGDEWEKNGLSKRVWPRLMARVLEAWDGSGPYVHDELRRRMGFPALREAVVSLHRPQKVDEFDRGLVALKFSELFHHQLLMELLRRRRRLGNGPVVTGEGERLGRFLGALPFELSPGQQAVIREIRDDLASGHPMHRLLQGEVGAGKTVVAFAAAALLADAGYQTAIMAPTEILARQHYRNALVYCEPAGLKAVLVTGGRDPEETRRALFEAAVGAADIIIGTHALFQERVRMPRLGLAVIDEQHRFGVRQRAMLVGKAESPPLQSRGGERGGGLSVGTEMGSSVGNPPLPPPSIEGREGR